MARTPGMLANKRCGEKGITMGKPTGYATNRLMQGADGKWRPAWALRDTAALEYYDTEWGRPVHSERGVFEQLSLEVFQAGLSWLTILKKRDALRAAFDHFEPEVVAAYGEDAVARLRADSRIVRNERKIRSTIGNAQATMRLASKGGLAQLVWSFAPKETVKPRTPEEVPTQSPESVALAKALRAHGFTGIGPITAFAMMAAIGVVDVLQAPQRLQQ
jgi:DNA-3-methyladenine glycosylase I